MENYLPLLQTTSLFAGLEQPALRMLLRDLCAVVRSYGRGETLVQAGHSNRRVGVVLSGTIQAYRPAPGGTHLPITHMEAGGVFGDVLARLEPPSTSPKTPPASMWVMGRWVPPGAGR